MRRLVQNDAWEEMKLSARFDDRLLSCFLRDLEIYLALPYTEERNRLENPKLNS